MSFASDKETLLHRMQNNISEEAFKDISKAGYRLDRLGQELTVVRIIKDEQPFNENCEIDTDFLFVEPITSGQCKTLFRHAINIASGIHEFLRNPDSSLKTSALKMPLSEAEQYLANTYTIHKNPKDITLPINFYKGTSEAKHQSLQEEHIEGVREGRASIEKLFDILGLDKDKLSQYPEPSKILDYNARSKQ